MKLALTEFDGEGRGFIEPSEVLKPIAGLTDACLFCFFNEVIGKLAGEGVLRERPDVKLGSEIGRNPAYELDVDGTTILVVHPGVGAPLAGAFMDELIAYGVSRFLAVGGAGALDGSLTLGKLIIPTSAVRDEGMSFHYAEPSRVIEGDTVAHDAIQRFLIEKNVPFVAGKTWTTDAIYRETHKKIADRKAEGCLTVEMETSAFMAVAQFRGVRFGQILFAGDDVSGDEWDSRNWQKDASTRTNLFWLGAEAVLRLPIGNLGEVK